jgi:hypothetical protein
LGRDENFSSTTSAEASPLGKHSKARSAQKINLSSFHPARRAQRQKIPFHQLSTHLGAEALAKVTARRSSQSEGGINSPMSVIGALARIEWKR